jgi:hypothetical protein
MSDTVLGGIGFFLLFTAVVVAGRTARKAARESLQSSDPQTVLRRCRQELQLVEIELSSFPATREMHAIFAGIRSAEVTIDQVARQLSSSQRQ